MPLTIALEAADRPMMPTAVDEQRAIHQFTRLQILMEDWDEVLEEWREEHIGAERSQVWGLVDTSSNTLAEMARQLSTPGLYGRRPRWFNQDGEAKGLTGEGGLYDQAGVSSKMAFVNYLTIGLGDWFIRWDVNNRGEFIAELVPPHNIYLREDSDNPGTANQLWRLRRKFLRPEDLWIFVWEVYDLGRVDALGEFARPPSFRVHRASRGRRPSNDAVFQPGGLGEDLSRRFVINPRTREFGPLVGDQYPWISEVDGMPRFPWGHWKDADTGQLWNTFTKRGAHRGALNAALYWTYAGHCARDATGSYVIVAGLHPGNISTLLGPGGGSGVQQNRNPLSGDVPVQTKLIEPGAIDYHVIRDGETPFVHEVGPGANLEDVTNFADRYDMKQAVRWGLNPSDLSRQAANPSSAAALMVSNEGKREFSAQVEPVFRRADLMAVQAAAIVARVGGLGAFPETGYSVQYHKIAASIGEKKAQREQLTWEQDQGQMSQVDVYRQLNQGTSEEDAIAGLIQIRLQDARLKAATEEALETAGLVEATPDAATDIELAPTDLAAVITVNEARAQEGLGPIPGGELTVDAFKKASEATAAAAAAAANPPPPPTESPGENDG